MRCLALAAHAAYNRACSSATACRSSSGPPNSSAISITLPRCEIGGTLRTSGMTNCAVPCSAYFSSRSVSIARASGPYFSKKFFSSFLTRSARSRRVRNGPLKARWHSRSKGSASGWLLDCSQLIEIDAALFQFGDDLGAKRRIRPLFPQVGRRRIDGSHFLGGVFGESHDAQLPPVRIELVNQMRGDLDLAAVKVKFTAGPLRNRR